MGIGEKIPCDRRLAIGSAFFVANAFIWYFFAANFLEDYVVDIFPNAWSQNLFWVAHIGTLAISLVAGTLIVKKVETKRLVIFWTLLGVFSPLILLASNIGQVPIAFAAGILFSFSTGLGMPACMEFFKSSTQSSSRGRYSGLILLISGLGLFGLRLIGEGIVLTVVILSVWRLLGLLGLFITKPFDKTKKENEQQEVSYRSIIGQRSFILYIIPWAMFSFVNYLSIPVQANILGADTINSLQVIENAIVGISAVAAGFLMDYVGRKQAAIFGFALLGLSYAILGIYPNEIMSWYIYTVLDGITWGILTILFVICIWGELNPHQRSDRYYALGILPFFLSKFLQLTLTGYITAGIEPNTLFSFTAFFLFVAVLPLVYAPETLPEKLRKDRDLKSYIESAKNKAQKELEKTHKKEKEEDSPANEKTPETEKHTDYEDAVKLAEKYY